METGASPPKPKNANPRQGRMKRHRGLITAATFVVALAVLAGPAPAGASTLLSGYGGPGQGNQAIIGETLINPPGGGSGGSGGGGGGSASSGETLATSATSSSSAAAAATDHAGGIQHRASTGNPRPHASAGGGAAYTPASESAAPAASVGSSTLGLSGADFVYIVLVLGGIVGVGMLTRRLAGPVR
jgi:hypothetical protein